MRLIKTIIILVSASLLACDDSNSEQNGTATGQGGSMTRFAIQGEYLYVVDQSMLNVFNTQNDIFEKVGEVPVGGGLETIFASNGYLYLGAIDGMYIFSLADPSQPSFQFRYAHIVSCDPVFVQGNRAFVTLSSGTTCNRGANALEIIDITDPYAPVLIQNYSMTSPRGLSVDNNLLFLCEGINGFKVYDISNEQNIQLLTHLTMIHSYDVIARNGLLIITGKDGIFQYSYDRVTGSLVLRSTIPVHRSEL
ncbi:MAG: hypothetical protein WKF87_10185 [Chryseolinea sp.]